MQPLTFYTLLCCRLLRSWSFQAKLGIVTNTLLAAAPQLGHLLLVITGCLLLIACVAVLALGGRVTQLSSAGAAIEESFSVLLGLGSVGLADVLPRGVRLPAAEALLALGVYYLRVVLLVMVLSQYFMATLGAEFSRLKWLGHALQARSIGADVAADVAPEVALRLQHLAARTQRWKRGLSRCRTRASVVPATPAQLAAASASTYASCGSIGSSKQALQLIRQYMPQLDCGSDTEQRSDSKPAVKVMGRQLDLPALQHILLQLADGSECNKLQLRTIAGGQAAAATATGAGAAAAAASRDLEAADGAEGVSAAGAAAAATAAVAAALLGSLQGAAIQGIGPVGGCGGSSMVSAAKVRGSHARHCIVSVVCSLISQSNGCKICSSWACTHVLVTEMCMHQRQSSHWQTVREIMAYCYALRLMRTRTPMGRPWAWTC